MEEPTIELEHAIGYSGIPMSLHYHPNGKEFVYAAGGCIVVTAFDDPHNQTFLRGHGTSLSSVIMSKTGNLVACAQVGQDSDVLVWHYGEKQLMYVL